MLLGVARTKRYIDSWVMCEDYVDRLFRRIYLITRLGNRYLGARDRVASHRASVTDHRDGDTTFRLFEMKANISSGRGVRRIPAA